MIGAAIALALTPLAAAQERSDVDVLVAALLGDTPMVDDLRYLTDTIGGRVTGTDENIEAVDWAVSRFEEAGVNAARESFQAPRFWRETGLVVEVSGDADFSAHAVAKHYSAATGSGGRAGSLISVGTGSEAEIDAIGARAEGAWLLVHTGPVEDLNGLFAEYGQATIVERIAHFNGAAGVAYVSSRPHNLLYRLGAAGSAGNELPLIIIEREQGLRLERLLEGGAELVLNAAITTEDSGSFESYNVIGEIEGSDLRDEIIVIGAHLDSYGLGTGANDNGCNAMMLIDIARQMHRLGIQPRRTIRFALWNGEEQGFNGSRGYTVSHADELDRHRMATSIDIGSGRITGFWMNGRASDIQSAVESSLLAVDGLGQFHHSNETIVGTDNFDFLLQGVPNLVAIHDSANYGPNYHAESDTFDKVDQVQLRLNAAIVASMLMGMANDDALDAPRHSREQIQALIDTTPLAQGMIDFNVMDDWNSGARGRQ